MPVPRSHRSTYMRLSHGAALAAMALAAALATLPATADAARSSGTIVAMTGKQSDTPDWQHWEWSNIGSVVFWSDVPADMVSKAKSMNVPLAKAGLGMPDPGDWTDASKRSAYVSSAVSTLKSKGYHGTIFDYEGNSLSGAQKEAYVAMASEMADALSAAFGDMATLYVCVGGSTGYEWRNYNYTGLAGALAKLGAGGKLFLMEYDMNLWEDYTCIVSGTCSPAEAPYRAIDAGIQTYLKQVPARSLVLGLPWYGQLYTRLLGVPVGQGQVDYSDVADLVKKHGWKPTWEKDDKAWRVVCGNHACFDDKKGTEIWFEDATSLQPKYALAKKYGLAGVGMFEATMLPYVSQPDLAKAMWDAATQWDQ